MTIGKKWVSTTRYPLWRNKGAGRLRLPRDLPRSLGSLILLRSEIPSGMCAKLRTVAASNNRDHARNLTHYCLLAPHICMVLFFTHIPFVVNHTINATPPERLQQHPLLFTTNHTDCTFFVWRLNCARSSHPGHNTILLRRNLSSRTLVIMFSRSHVNIGRATTSRSLCYTQARAVNLIHAVLCDDEGVTQARGC